jgi:hypothetical protein
VARIADLPTADERRKATEDARRSARYKFAEDRIRKIVDGAPPLTAEQRDRLASLLRPSGAGAG